MIHCGKIINIPSNRYRAWHKPALQTLKNTPVRFEKTECVDLCFYGENKRKFDLSNRAESIMDLLVDAGIIPDDNYEIVPRLDIKYGGVSKENPRCEVIIYGKEIQC